MEVKPEEVADKCLSADTLRWTHERGCELLLKCCSAEKQFSTTRQGACEARGTALHCFRHWTCDTVLCRLCVGTFQLVQLRTAGGSRQGEHRC